MFIGINQVINDINKKYHGLSRKVLQIHPLSLNIVYIWNSTVEASKFLNINQECIVGTCNGKYKHAGGYFWKYYDELVSNHFLRCDKNNQCDIFNLIYTGNLSNYISPCFTFDNNEIWKDIEGYEGLYKVSNYGNVLSYKEKPYIKILSQSMNQGGYKCVKLFDNNFIKTDYRVHRLVAEAFIPNPENLPHVNHKDEIKINNFVTNLEWCTHEYNMNYGTRLDRFAKSVSSPVQQVDLKTGEVINEFWGIKEAERVTGVKACNISEVCNKKRKSSGGYGWKHKT